MDMIVFVFYDYVFLMMFVFFCDFVYVVYVFLIFDDV